MTVQLWANAPTGKHVSNHVSATEAKRFAAIHGFTGRAHAAWNRDETFHDIAVNDFDSRKVHEFDPERNAWYAVEMWEGATPIGDVA